MPPLLGHLGRAFAYPWQGGGRYVWLGGALLFGLLDWLAHLEVVGAIFFILSCVAGATYALEIVLSTTNGETEPPEWPDVHDLVSGWLWPACLVFGGVVVAGLPSALVAIVLGYRSTATSVEGRIVVELFYLLGMGVLPMALLSVALDQRIVALNPVHLARSIAVVGREYLVVCLHLAATIMLWRILTVALAPIPVVGGFLAGGVATDCGMVTMHMIGLIYIRPVTRRPQSNNKLLNPDVSRPIPDPLSRGDLRSTTGGHIGP